MPDSKSDIEAVKRELERRSQDTILVYNPTKNQRQVVWNRFIHVVKPQAEAVLPRYIAEKYIKEMVTFLIMDKNDERVRKENDRRLKAGLKVMDAQEREVFDWRSNNQELRKQYMPLVYRGIVEEYGKADVSKPIMSQETIVAKDEDIMAELDRMAKAEKDIETLPDVEGVDLEVEEKKREAIARVAA